MSLALTFDTLAYAKKLEAAGLSSKMAEAQAGAQADVVSSLMAHLASKDDLKALELATKNDLKAFEHELKSFEQATKNDFKALEQATKKDLKELEYKLTFRLGGIVVTGIAVLAALMTILIHHY